MELGSEFCLKLDDMVRTENNIYKELEKFDYILLDNARHGIQLLLQNLCPKGKILLPSYICESVIKCFKDYPVEFYQLNEKLEIDIGSLSALLAPDVSLFYLCHYFGALQSDSILQYLEREREKCGFVIVEDTTHSFFTESLTIGDYGICSLRKWMSVPDGGVLYAKHCPELNQANLPRSHPADKLYAMQLKSVYLAGIEDCNAVYRKLFAEHEKFLNEDYEVKSLSEISRILMEYTDVYELKRRRRKNYVYLRERLSKKGIKPAGKNLGGGYQLYFQ